MMAATRREGLIHTVARLLTGARHVAVGAASPIPAAGAMLLRALRERDGDEPLTISILGSVKHNFFTNGSAELFDCAAQGRIDAFFLGGGQIDGAGNINLVGTGGYPQTEVRWPGSFGAALLAYVVPRIILFREEHSPRVLVDTVDFISAPGTSPPEVYRTGGPHALLTSLALFSFDRGRGRFRLDSVHGGSSVAEVRAKTGFAFDAGADVQRTPDPDAETLLLLRGPVLDALAETYPQAAAIMSAEISEHKGA
jgi:glutaconate CoA-transferase, subunit B